MTAEVGLHCELWIAGDDRLEAVMDAVADAVPHVSVLWLLVRCPFTVRGTCARQRVLI
jgi:hypothetical protein